MMRGGASNVFHFVQCMEGEVQWLVWDGLVMEVRVCVRFYLICHLGDLHEVQ